MELFVLVGLAVLPACKRVATIVLVLICFLCGMLFRIPLVRQGFRALESGILSHISGYVMLKSKASDTLGEETKRY